MTQGARASGMGLAFTAVADDPTAIFYNPAGLGWMTRLEGSLGASLLSRTSGGIDGANPYPGAGRNERYQKQSFFLPNAYGVVPLMKNVTFGIGTFAPYGLGLRWQNPEVFTGTPGSSPVNGAASFSGRFISQNAVIKSLDVNPVVAVRLLPEVAFAVGADLRYSKIMLERNSAAVNPFTNSIVDIAHARLDSDLLVNHGWGWNAGILVKPTDMFSFGVAYRSMVKMDYKLDATFTQRPTGNAQLDAGVAAQLPPAQKAATVIKFPASLNIGAAVSLLDSRLTISGEADWTEWSSFRSLDVVFATTPALNIHRLNLWTNSWAYRGGIQYKVTKQFAVRAGYYYDKTPQPAADAGPILSDNNRNVYTFGFGYNTERWGVDVGDLYIKFKDRRTPAANTDKFYGTYKEAANVGSINFRLAF